MWSAIKSIFTSNDVVQAGIAGIDKSVLTKEERLDYFMQMMKAYAPFKIAQRLIGLTFCGSYALMWLAAGVLYAVDKPNTGLLELLHGDMATLVGVIVMFYFGGGAVEGVIRARGDKRE